jgi:hypothetical protein
MNFLNYKIADLKMEAVIRLLQLKLDRYRLDNPNADITDQQEKIDGLIEAKFALSELFDEKERLRELLTATQANQLRELKEKEFYKNEAEKLKANLAF